jgi:SepF-like predicted cell division protein (DUF552 family)
LKGLPKLRKSSDKVGTKIGNSEKTQLAASETVQKNIQAKVYLKALPLRALGDVDIIKREIESGNILILKVSPLAVKSIDDVKVAVSELVEFTKSVGGDIARLGEERVVITPAPIRIWREKTVAPNGAMPTAA